MIKEKEISARGPNPDKIKCKDCFWGMLLGYLASACSEYSRKPNEIYFDGEDCPCFKPKGGDFDGNREERN